MATIYKPTRLDPETGERVKSKKWVIAYRDHTGRRRKAPGFTDRAATQQLAAKIERDTERRRAGLIDETTDNLGRSITEAIDAFMVELARLGRTKPYRDNIERFLTRIRTETKPKWLTLADIRPDTLRAFLATLANQGRGGRTQNHYRNSVICFVNWCVRQGWLPTNPLVTVPKVKERRIDRKRPRRAYTTDEVRRLIALNNARTPIYIIAAFSGLRRGDLARLQVRDVDFTDPLRPLWRLRAEAVKEARDVTLPMSPEAAAAIQPLIHNRPRHERIFPSMPTRRTLYLDLARAGITRADADGRKVDFHSFRYFFCTTLAKTLPLMKVKMLMRHQDIKQTANLYSDLGLTDVGDDVWTLPRLLLEMPAPQNKKERPELRPTA